MFLVIDAVVVMLLMHQRQVVSILSTGVDPFFDRCCLPRFVHSDAPVAPLDTAGMLVREDPIPGTNYDNGRLILAELGYTETESLQ